jgi:hypothetical protein
MTRIFNQSQSHGSRVHSKTYSEVATSTSTFGNDIADLIGEVLLASDAGDRLLDVELDRRHCYELMSMGCTTERRVVVEPDGWAAPTTTSKIQAPGDGRRPPPGVICADWTEVHLFAGSVISSLITNHMPS